MSQKQAKAKRREEKEAQVQAATPIGSIIIDVFPNFDVDVKNFPSEHSLAMMILANAMLKVSAHFVTEQQLQNNKSNLLIAKPGASRADIIKMAAGN